MEPAVKIKWSGLPGVGSVPTYDVPAVHRHRIYAVGEDGNSIVMFAPNAIKHRFHVPMFEIAKPRAEWVHMDIRVKARALCVAAGFAGTAWVVVRSSYKLRSNQDAWHYCLDAGIFFTVDSGLELDPFDRWLFSQDEKLPTEAFVGDDKRFHDALHVMEVMES